MRENTIWNFFTLFLYFKCHVLGNTSNLKTCSLINFKRTFIVSSIFPKNERKKIEFSTMKRLKTPEEYIEINWPLEFGLDTKEFISLFSVSTHEKSKWVIVEQFWKKVLPSRLFCLYIIRYILGVFCSYLIWLCHGLFNLRMQN